MPTKAERRAAARAERELREAADAQAAGRKRRLYMLGGAVVVAAAVVGIAIAISSGGGSSNSSGGGNGGAIQGAAEVNAELAGIPQSGNTLGQASAPVTITEFADLQCPICHEFNQDTLSKLIPNEVKAGHAKLVFRNLQTATQDNDTFKAEAKAAMAAGKQNKQWHYVELFYRNQGEENSGYVDGTFLTNIAKAIPGLDLTQWTQDRTDSSLETQLTADAALAQSLGFKATPSLLIKGPKFPSQAISGAASYSDLQKAIKAVGGTTSGGSGT
jgi:protein-disulfide isomerase